MLNSRKVRRRERPHKECQERKETPPQGGLRKETDPIGRVRGRERPLTSVLVQRGPQEVSGKMTWNIKVQLCLSLLSHSFVFDLNKLLALDR